ncbi:MAG: hypothetical protein R3Y05_01385 [bacterium]
MKKLNLFVGCYTWGIFFNEDKKLSKVGKIVLGVAALAVVATIVTLVIVL